MIPSTPELVSPYPAGVLIAADPRVASRAVKHVRRRIRARLAAASALGLGLLLTAVPAAEAGSSWGLASPINWYTPRHIAQSQDNCIWAAGAMLLDKWTHGRVRVGQARLRKASGDEEGGSSLRDLTLGVARATGIRLHYSPSWAQAIAWWQLLDRLEHGGGAVLVGSYGKFPLWYSRWEPAFARSRDDSHAVYVERYERAKGRVWLMDPLAPGRFRGEWIDVRHLRRYATFTGDYVHAAATPARRWTSTAPLTDVAYRLGRPSLARAASAGTRLGVTIPLTIEDGFPTPAAHRIVGRWARLPDPAAAAPLNSAPGSAAASAQGSAAGRRASRPSGPTMTWSKPIRASSIGFSGAIPVPTQPGRYRLTLGLVPARSRSKRPIRSVRSVEIRVLGNFSAALEAPPAAEAGSDSRILFEVRLTNLGTADWGQPAEKGLAVDEGPGSKERGQTMGVGTTVLLVTWRAADGTERPGITVAAELAPRAVVTLPLTLRAPRQAGDWTLVFDIVSGRLGSLSSAGLALPSVKVKVIPVPSLVP